MEPQPAFGRGSQAPGFWHFSLKISVSVLPFPLRELSETRLLLGSKNMAPAPIANTCNLAIKSGLDLLQPLHIVNSGNFSYAGDDILKML